jgi:glycosyltransferase involved in cell wall biosynthesis
MAERLRGFRPAVLHAHFGTDGLLALPLARALGVPLVTTLRGYDINLSRRTLLLSGRSTWMGYALGRRRLIEGGDLFLAVCDFLRRRAIAAGFPEDRIVTHYNGVDVGRFRPGAEQREEGLILHVANLVTKKGTAQLIEAFADVKREVSAARLTILGGGPLEGALRRQAAGLGLAGSIHFAGHLGRDEVAAWMRRACVLAVPSTTGASGDAEGLPNVVVEAAASGLPVVATNHAGIPEAVADGVTGLLVPERDSAALAQALAALLRGPDRRNRMADAARRRAVAKFDAARQMERLESHYDRLAAR